MSLQATGSKVIVEIIKEQDEGGIIVPDNVRQDNQEKSRVVSVGPGTLLENGSLFPVGVKAGDVVYFRQFAGSKITDKDTEYLVLNEEEILAVEK